MNIKIIFIDFDWTIFDHRSYSINQKTIQAIKEARNKGIKVIINTGRTYFSLMSKEIVRNLKIDGYVLNNGGLGIVDDKVIYAEYLSNEDKINLIKFFDEHQISYGITTDFKSYGKIYERGNVERFLSVYDEPKTLDMKEFNINENVLSFTFFETNYIDKIIKDNFNNLCINRYLDYVADVCKIPFLKNVGVERILKYLNIDPKDALAIGDDTNDLDMFKACEYSICVGNGKEEVKKEATFIAKDIKDDGIYDILKECKII